MFSVLTAKKKPFQSTLPVWGATTGTSQPVHNPVYFNPRSPCGERPGSNSDFTKSFTISIHAPRVGSDVVSTIVQQPTGISIHAPRVGSDSPRIF